MTKIDDPGADVERADRWLRLTGCKKIFHVNSKTGEGVAEILDYLREEGDEMPWEAEKTQEATQETTSNNKN